MPFGIGSALYRKGGSMRELATQALLVAQVIHERRDSRRIVFGVLLTLTVVLGYLAATALIFNALDI
jgi:hypothetical protein